MGGHEKRKNCHNARMMKGKDSPRSPETTKKTQVIHLTDETKKGRSAKPGFEKVDERVNP